MAQRLATEYVKTCLQLTEADMLKFFQMFVDHQVTLQVKVLENGNQEVVFQDGEVKKLFSHLKRNRAYMNAQDPAD